MESIPGEGSCIRLAVPLTAMQGEESAVEANPAQTKPPRTLAPCPQPATADRQVRVLMVDDHAIVRKGISNVLSGDNRLVVVGAAAFVSKSDEIGHTIKVVLRPDHES